MARITMSYTASFERSTVAKINKAAELDLEECRKLEKRKSLTVKVSHLS